MLEKEVNADDWKGTMKIVDADAVISFIEQHERMNVIPIKWLYEIRDYYWELSKADAPKSIKTRSRNIVDALDEILNEWEKGK